MRRDAPPQAQGEGPASLMGGVGGGLLAGRAVAGGVEKGEGRGGRRRGGVGGVRGGCGMCICWRLFN